ncbi:MAG: 50S ribosomal protein L18 [Candidatus Abawacabacteria bacterium RBG_16_42_10]|uniref:Large ribosomal subunit protein uL18 n=1 Tax=Candidatus Abawacabacteria bacterium RBG_16_42_10 TaxID=1817814 RepID=A0A1F4XIF2_9BACT|nr:ribosomal protein L18 [uncultured bacterium]OGC81400.1 MAG: 50S ribosomal protein L18 [Candidatus Abawacabacteria bacterium RBG_16_42_10]
MNKKQLLHSARRARVKAKIVRSNKPRLVVFRSLKYIYGQLIDNNSHKILASANDMKGPAKGTKSDRAKEVGRLLGEKIIAQNIKVIAFDRNGYRYHGRVKALATGLRDTGLQF